ncbi:FAD-binding oxidoreductase [Flavobacteriaceae bacterium]|nr:FAD-binding oxidoreductase [Flavobacteriaceae bacterium]
MNNVDYLIVGSGLAGILFAEVLKSQHKTFLIIDDASQQSSVVAGGLYNPVILKRFTEVWKAKEQLDLAIPIYERLENSLGIKFDHKISVKRLFNSIQEQNNWFLAADKPNLSKFLSHKIMTNENPNIRADYGFGTVLHTGRIDTSLLVKTYKKDLDKEGLLYDESFNYRLLKHMNDYVIYNNIKTKNIVFAEGFGLKNNPYFCHLPLNGTKGELITIFAPDLKINYVLKSSVFIIPIGNDFYVVGSTYERKDKSNAITLKAKNELVFKLTKFIKCDFDIVNQSAGIRPTVKDRRPLVGRHKTHSNVYVLNGLGTRGVMIAPYVAKQLFDFIEYKKPLDAEINSNRFE